MRIKSMISLMLAVCCAALMLCGCTGAPSQGKNSAEYGSPAEFEGEAHDVRLMFVNVGKADCAIVDIDGRAWLVDTGTEESFIETCAALAYMGIDELAGVILSHGHDDHMGGLFNLLQKYPVDIVYYPACLIDNAETANAILEAGAQGVTVMAGDNIAAAPGAEFEVLAPLRQLTVTDDNDNSLVIKLAVNGRSFLFTGDMQKTEESTLLESGADVSCDVLKVGNHGNRDATSQEFAQAASPLIAVISTDTSVDPNSANGMVKSYLGMADIIITQDTGLGVLLTVSRKGEITVEYPAAAQPSAQKVAVTAASKADQYFTVKNEGGEEADISGWFVYSSKGYEVFFFPQGTVLSPGAELTVACLKSSLVDTADLVWQEKKAWSDTKEDIAVLCDSNACEISRHKSE